MAQLCAAAPCHCETAHASKPLQAAKMRDQPACGALLAGVVVKKLHNVEKVVQCSRALFLKIFRREHELLSCFSPSRRVLAEPPQTSAARFRHVQVEDIPARFGPFWTHAHSKNFGDPHVPQTCLAPWNFGSWSASRRNNCENDRRNCISKNPRQ